jgi:hypothetical protein
MQADKLAATVAEAGKIDRELSKPAPGAKPPTPPAAPAGKPQSPEDRPLDGDLAATALPPPTSVQWASLLHGGAMLCAQFAPEVQPDIAQAFGPQQCEAWGSAVAPAFDKWGIRPPGEGSPEITAILATVAVAMNAARIFENWKAIREAEAKRASQPNERRGNGETS